MLKKINLKVAQYFFQDDADLGPLEPDWEDDGGDGHERARRMFKELDQER